MRDYELMTIHHPDLEEAEVSTKIDELGSLLERDRATVNKKDLWGRRRFAYEIDHMTEGHYTLITFSSEPGPVANVDRILGLADEVIRHKILVSHGISTVSAPPTIDAAALAANRDSRRGSGNRRSSEA
ncbi:MAG: 30S ribosomal protein S6 [Acidimicrobiia bacterium]|nr:30S ribosomal protein S6 [Acidimicrobiia bacterium]